MRIARSLSAILSGLTIAALVACAPTAKREGTGEYIDDSLITGKVKAALVADFNLGPSPAPLVADPKLRASLVAIVAFVRSAGTRGVATLSRKYDPKPCRPVSPFVYNQLVIQINGYANLGTARPHLRSPG